jgi:hypothetical protein
MMGSEAFEKYYAEAVPLFDARNCHNVCDKIYAEHAFLAGRASIDAEKIADKILCEYFPDGANADLTDVERLRNTVIAAVKECVE